MIWPKFPNLESLDDVTWQTDKKKGEKKKSNSDRDAHSPIETDKDDKGVK